MLAAAVLAGGCAKGADSPKDKGSAEQATDIAADTVALRAAEAAAGEVIRNASDCAAAKAAFAEANRKLEEAAGRVRAPLSRTTIENLKKQVKAIVDGCP